MNKTFVILNILLISISILTISMVQLAYASPTFVEKGGVSNSQQAITPSLPTGIQSGDVLILVVETANQPITITNAGSSGPWTQLTSSPQGTGTAEGNSATRITVWYATYGGSGTTGPTLSDSGNHQIGEVFAFRNVDQNNPIGVTVGSTESTEDTSASIPGATTTKADSLILAIMGTALPDANGSTQYSGQSNPDLSNITEIEDITRNSGNGGGISVTTGKKATIGSYGPTLVTTATSTAKAMISLALNSKISVAPTLSISQPDGVGDTISIGDPYNITYTLSDPDDVVTASFYYDMNNSGLDGMAISGTCATAAEGNGVTCTWDTTGMSLGNYYVYGITDDGTNPPVNAYSTGQITISTVPFAPTGLTATAVSSSQIDLSWTAPSDGGSPITGYMVEQKSQGPWTVIVTNTGSPSTTYSVTGLDANITYQYRISAINTVGTGSASDATSATTLSAATVPSQVTGLTATAVSSSQIDLSWTAPSDGGSPITGYKIERESPVGGGWSTLVADTGSTGTTYSNTGLTSNTQYNYRVSAINAIGTGSASTPANATTLSAATVPSQVTGLTATAVSSSQIDLSWTAPSDGGSPITGYKIERESPVGGGWSTLVADTGSTGTTYSNTGLTDNTQYNYRVSAINGIGTGTASNESAATTLSTLTTPTQPMDLNAIAGDGFVTLNWNPPSSDGGDPISDYVIKYSNDNGATWQIYDDGISISTSVTISGLENNRNYLFQVFAVNSIEQGPPAQVSEMPIDVLSMGTKNQRSPPQISGIGFYTITPSDSRNSYSNIIQETKQQLRFEDFFPYSVNSDLTDQKNYGKSFGYDKYGGYIPFSKRSDAVLFSTKINNPLQIQVRIDDQYASTKIEHVSLFIAGNGQKSESYSVELVFDKGKAIQVKDPQKFIKDVKVNDFLEDASYWVNFDLVFQKEIKLSDILLETWHEGRNPAYGLFVGSIEATENITPPVSDTILLTAKIEMSHDTSSPVCKANNTCFVPNNVTILKNGIVTWYNPDSFMHDVESGTPNNPDNRFDLHVMPGESKQKSFGTPGIYKYFCSLHPWATGSITVVDSQQNIVKEYDEVKQPIIIASVTPKGSVMIEQNQEVIKNTKDMKVEISGNIQEGSSNSVTITIIRPDGTSDDLRVLTNDRGYYFIPTNLNKKWLEGDYVIITKYDGVEIGQLKFTVKQNG